MTASRRPAAHPDESPLGSLATGQNGKQIMARKPDAGSSVKPVDDRRKRLAEQLRRNLKRRKAAAGAGSGEGGGPPKAEPKPS